MRLRGHEPPVFSHSGRDAERVDPGDVGRTVAHPRRGHGVGDTGYTEPCTTDALKACVSGNDLDPAGSRKFYLVADDETAGAQNVVIERAAAGDQSCP